MDALLKRGRERGWVTVGEVNAALPPDRVTPKEIAASMRRPSV